MTNNRLARTTSMNAISDQEEKTVFGVTQAIIQRMNESLRNYDDTGLLWSTGLHNDGAQNHFVKTTDTDCDVQQYGDGRKDLFRQRFSRLRNNVIGHKN